MIQADHCTALVVNPDCGCGKYIEIGNNVFMQYNKTAEGKYESLKQRNIDVGLGLERTLCIHQRTTDIYATDLFTPIMQCISELCESQESKAIFSSEQEHRLTSIIADHLRAATFILADGVVPNNVEQGYICRWLIRRAVRMWS